MTSYFKTHAPLLRRDALRLAVAAAGLIALPAISQARRKVQVGLSTKTWWPSIVAETAQTQGLFAKSGIEAELTIYRSGGEAFEALAAGAADLITGVVSQVGTGRRRGINTKLVALGTTSNTGWKMLVRRDSPVRTVQDLAGKKVGITASGSLSDLMALWSKAVYKVDFTSVPLGGGGLVPNLISGNVDAAIIYSPLSFQVLQANEAKEVLDFANAMPAHLATGWATRDDFISGRRSDLQATLSSIYSAVSYMQRDRSAAVKIISEVNGIAPAVAQQEYEETYLKLSRDGRFTMEQTRAAMDLARIGGFKDMAAAEDVASLDLTPVVVRS